MNHRFASRITLLGLALGTYLCAGCADGSSNATSGTAPTGRPQAAAHTPVDPAAEVITIERNTQATLGDVRIGAGNFYEEAYTAAGGGSGKRLTAGLWIYVRDDSSKDQQVRVHAGQILSVPGYRLEVIAVEPTAVRLAVSKTTDPQ